MTETNAVQNPLADIAKGIWWWVLIRGIFAVIFGIIALASPGAALLAIAIVYGAYALVDGITAIVHAVRVRDEFPQWGWLLFGGILSTLAGLVALILPGIVGIFGGLVLLWTIVVWAITTGVTGIRSAAGAASGSGKTWGIVAGVLGVLFGIALGVITLLTPGDAVLSLIWVVAVYAIVFGVMLVATAIMVRVAGREIVTPAD